MSTSYLIPGTGTDGTQLWVLTVNSDGTSSARELLNFYPGKDPTYGAFNTPWGPGVIQNPYFTPFKNGFLFAASGLASTTTGQVAAGGKATGAELWYTDGTVNGTHLVTDLYSATPTSSFTNGAGIPFNPPSITVLANGSALWIGRQGGSAIQTGQLFATDGSYGTYTPLTGNKSVFGNPNIYGDLYNVIHLTSLNGNAAFFAYVTKAGAAVQRYLFMTDGTNPNTNAVIGEQNAVLAGLYRNNVPEGAFVTSSGTQELFFTGSDNQLWETDGSTAKQLTTTLTSQSAALRVYDLGSGTALFASGADLWVTHGAGGQTAVIDAGINAANLTNFNGSGNTPEGFFTTYDSTAMTTSLFVTDGTAAGTKVGTVNGAQSSISSRAISGHLLFTYTTAGGTTVLDSISGPTGGITRIESSGVSTLTAGPAGEATFFKNGSLYVTDGTTNGTRLVNATGASYETVAGSNLFFISNDSNSVTHVYGLAAGNTGAAVQLNLNGDTVTGSSTLFGVLGNDVLFQATNGGGGTDNWISDGTQTGTHLVTSTGALSPSVGQGSNAAAALPCFLAGTRLRTPRGEVAVEGLQAGDTVLTHFGRAAPIAWVGRSGFDVATHPRPNEATPIRIRAGALGDRVPARDLLVSPGHSLLIDGVLMQAERLVNGATIVRDTAIRRGEYFHVELDRHDIVISEGAPSESYLDTGNRIAFANGGSVVSLHPDFSPRDATDTCVPLVTKGPALLAARKTLIERAGSLGWQRIDVAVFEVVADGIALAAVDGDATWSVFAVPAGATCVRVRSAAAIAAERMAEPDPRRLGVLLAGVAVVRGRSRSEFALTDPALRSGWHDVERHDGADWRWTDGDAELAISGPCLLELAVSRGLPHWQAPADAADIELAA